MTQNLTFFFQGECWSGKDTRDTYNRAGSSTTCLGKDFKQCKTDSSYPCVGKIEENFVYEIPVEHSKLLVFV